ncbi:tRNA threonylcarbamoyladenosine biosynthesis protein TsaB [compost metagenome]
MPGNWVLGLNTASENLGVALVQGEALRADLVLVPETYRSGHGERLQPAIAHLCELCGITPAGLSGVAVASGPGGFTGVRTGMSAAKAIALALGLPVAPVPTLEALAAQSPLDGLVAPMLDARKDKVFAALYRRDAQGLQELVPGCLMELQDWLEQLARYSEPITFIGEGAQRQRTAIAEHFSASWLSEEMHLLRAGSVALLGARMLARGEGVDALNVLPTYMREPTAVAGWERLGPPGA